MHPSILCELPAKKKIMYLFQTSLAPPSLWSLDIHSTIANFNFAMDVIIGFISSMLFFMEVTTSIVSFSPQNEIPYE